MGVGVGVGHLRVGGRDERRGVGVLGAARPWPAFEAAPRAPQGLAWCPWWPYTPLVLQGRRMGCRHALSLDLQRRAPHHTLTPSLPRCVPTCSVQSVSGSTQGLVSCVL